MNPWCPWLSLAPSMARIHWRYQPKPFSIDGHACIAGFPAYSACFAFSASSDVFKRSALPYPCPFQRSGRPWAHSPRLQHTQHRSTGLPAISGLQHPSRCVHRHHSRFSAVRHARGIRWASRIIHLAVRLSLPLSGLFASPARQLRPWRRPASLFVTQVACCHPSDHGSTLIPVVLAQFQSNYFGFFGGFKAPASVSSYQDEGC